MVLASPGIKRFPCRYRLFRVLQGLLIPPAHAVRATAGRSFALLPFSRSTAYCRIVGNHASQSTYDQVRHQSADRLFPVPGSWHYLQNSALCGFRHSPARYRSAIATSLHAFPATLELATLALIIGTVLGVIAGVLCARYAGSPLDLAIRTFTLLGNSVTLLARTADVFALFYANLQWSATLAGWTSIWQFTAEPMN